MKNKVIISKINIKIGDKEIPLSLDEARELQQVLDEVMVRVSQVRTELLRKLDNPKAYLEEQ